MQSDGDHTQRQSELKSLKYPEVMFCTRQDVCIPMPQASNERLTADQAVAEPSRRPFRFGGPFGSISQATMSHLPRSGSSSRKENATGMEFPEECCVLTQKNCPVLTGFGVRNKKLMGMKNIKVYAVGLYVDPNAAKKALDGKVTAGSAAPDQAIFDEIVQANDVEKSLRMVISFGGVNQKNFWSALQDRLEPAMKQGGDTASLQEFGSLFDDIKFRKGLQLNFTSASNGHLIAQIDDRQVGVIKSPLLTRTLFDVYLGSNPVSPDAKDSIGRGLKNLATEP